MKNSQKILDYWKITEALQQEFFPLPTKDIIPFDTLKRRPSANKHNIKKLYLSTITSKDLLAILGEEFSDINEKDMLEKTNTYLAYILLDDNNNLFSIEDTTIFINPIFYYLHKKSNKDFSEFQTSFSKEHAPPNNKELIFIPDTSALIQGAKYYKGKNLFKNLFPSGANVKIVISNIVTKELDGLKNSSKKKTSIDARRVSNDLYQAMEDETFNNVFVSNTIEVLEANSPGIYLDSLNDELIVHEALLNAKNNPNSYVYLYSTDKNQKILNTALSNNEEVNNIFSTSFISKNIHFEHAITQTLEDALNTIREKLLNTLELNKYEELFSNKLYASQQFYEAGKELELTTTASFFFDSLRQAPINNGISYLTKHPHQIDIRQDTEIKMNLNHISNTPKGRWASKYFLNHSQQNAINQYFLKYNTNEIVSINGAAGTGKTTLMKDVIANILIDKASAILDLKFECFDIKNNTPELKPELLSQFDILITSSNNSAVENITKELPLSSGFDFDYIKESPNNFILKDELKVLASANGSTEDYFCFISSALGNSNNFRTMQNLLNSCDISRYFKIAQDNKDEVEQSFLHQLNIIKNIKKSLSPVEINKKIAFINQEKKNLQSILTQINNIKQDTEVLKKRNTNFSNTIQEKEKTLSKIISSFPIGSSLERTIHLSSLFQSSINSLQSEHKKYSLIANKETLNKLTLQGINKTISESIEYKSSKLKILTSLEKKHIDLVSDCKIMQNDIDETTDKLDSMGIISKILFKHKRLKRDIKVQQELLDNKIQEIEFLEKKIENENKLLDVAIETYKHNKGILEQDHKDKLEIKEAQKQKDIISEAIHYEYEDFCQDLKISRDDISTLFEDINSINLLEKEIENYKNDIQNTKDKIKSNNTTIENKHDSAKQLQTTLRKKSKEVNFNKPTQQFYDMSSREIEISSMYNIDKFKYNQAKLFYYALRVLEINMILNFSNIKKSLFKSKDFIDTKNEKWLSIYSLFTPVVSSALASLPRMLKSVNNIGSIICDESGQATAPSGYIFMQKTKNALIAGDPLQIEPVVTLPQAIDDILTNKMNIEDKFSVTKSSVQTLCDDASQIGTLFGDNKVGMPLFVHRRCIEPIFSISNEISYDNQIINQTPPLKENDEVLVNNLHDSMFLDIRSSDDDFFGNISKKELEFAIDHIQGSLLHTNISYFIISPFKDKQRIFHTIANNKHKGKFGTTHTFQGKEADVVYFILGGKSEASRNWVASKANILNVAATRAKKRLYIIGDRKKWEKLEYFNKIGNHISFATLR
jgi:superfamily I DNA and/or RNA helicase